MDSLFACQKCHKTPFIPGPNLEFVYEGQTLCMMCRKAGGQKNFTPIEKMALYAEEIMASREKKMAIEKYLSKNIPNKGIEQKKDFDLSAQTFKVNIEKGFLLLKVWEPFVNDNDIPEIIRQFERWDLPGLLTKNSKSTVFVGNKGVKILKRS